MVRRREISSGLWTVGCGSGSGARTAEIVQQMTIDMESGIITDMRDTCWSQIYSRQRTAGLSMACPRRPRRHRPRTAVLRGLLFRPEPRRIKHSRPLLGWGLTGMAANGKPGLGLRAGPSTKRSAAPFANFLNARTRRQANLNGHEVAPDRSGENAGLYERSRPIARNNSSLNASSTVTGCDFHQPARDVTVSPVAVILVITSAAKSRGAMVPKWAPTLPGRGRAGGKDTSHRCVLTHSPFAH